MTTLPGVMDAFNDIYAFGSTCNSYYHETHRTPDGSEHCFDGPGDDFYESRQVPDIIAGRTVPAETMLRVVAAEDGSLYLRQQLMWTPSSGYGHESYASYLITPAATERLAATDVESLEFNPPSIFDSQGNLEMTAAFEAGHSYRDMLRREAAMYHAAWRQVLPERNLQPYLEFNHNLSAEFDNRVTITDILCEVYHQWAVEQLITTGAATTCMLSNSSGEDASVVHPQQLLTMAEWVRARPQRASRADSRARA